MIVLTHTQVETYSHKEDNLLESNTDQHQKELDAVTMETYQSSESIDTSTTLANNPSPPSSSQQGVKEDITLSVQDDIISCLTAASQKDTVPGGVDSCHDQRLDDSLTIDDIEDLCLDFSADDINLTQNRLMKSVQHQHEILKGTNHTIITGTLNKDTPSLAEDQKLHDSTIAQVPSISPW